MAPSRDLPGRVVVIGAGTMGARIAACLARAGVEVCATARHEQTLRSAAAAIRAALTAPADGPRPAGPPTRRRGSGSPPTPTPNWPGPTS